MNGLLGPLAISVLIAREIHVWPGSRVVAQRLVIGHLEQLDWMNKAEKMDELEGRNRRK
jgi:hypothetical protein